jgi:hypothetical protein
MADAGHRLLVVNLADDYVSPMNDPLFAVAPGTQWHQLWSSEHPGYGGGGVRELAAAGNWLIVGRSATLLGCVQNAPSPGSLAIA